MKARLRRGTNTLKKGDTVYLAREGPLRLAKVTWVEGDYIRVNGGPVDWHHIHWVRTNIPW